MRRVVEAKFLQHADLAATLLLTGDARIVEAATVDNEVNRRWGEVNGVGTNWLGLILMEVRGAIRIGLDRGQTLASLAESLILIDQESS
jgi:hypothetical protein